MYSLMEVVYIVFFIALIVFVAGYLTRGQRDKKRMLKRRKASSINLRPSVIGRKHLDEVEVPSFMR